MYKRIIPIILAGILIPYAGFAQNGTIDSKDIKKKASDLPMEPERTISFNTNEGTWMSLDISPDGQSIVFDLLGDIYTMSIGGGKATAITHGMPLESHPKYSPDGKHILYISDRSGSENLWYMNLETQKTTQVTKDNNDEMINAEWSPDGDYIVVARGRRNFKLWLYHKDGGTGVKLIDGPENLKTIDPAFSHDGKYIYYSQRTGAWNYNAQFPQYRIGRYNRDNAEQDVIINKYGSAFTPVTSPDGKWLVYGSRFEEKTGLIIRDLSDDSEEWLAYPVQRDDLESQATLGVLPAMSFTPDSKSLVTFYGGKIWSINIETNEATEIPFDTDVELELGPLLAFKYPVSDEKEVIATQIRNAVPSPNGNQLVFEALGKLYIQDLPEGTPRRLTDAEVTEAHPAWSPDGKWVAYVTWDKDSGGDIYKLEVNKRRAKPIKLNKASGFFGDPAWSYNSERIVLLSGSKYTFEESSSAGAYNIAMNDIVWISPKGGDINHIAEMNGRRNLHFIKSNDRIFYTSGGGRLGSMRWDGTDTKDHVRVTGISTYGTLDRTPPSNAGELYMAPEGDRVLAMINNEIYVATVPKTGEMVTIAVSNPDNAAFPATKLTLLGGEFPSWSDDASKVHWSLGKGHFIYDFDQAKAFADSVKKSKDEAETEEGEKEGSPASYEPQELRIEVTYTRDIPEGTVLLQGARVLTMKGYEQFERGDILVVNNRIQAVGQTGSLAVPDGATVINVSGKTIVPGYIDTHAHLRVNRGIHKTQLWSYAANLAYGVTTTRDPQTGSTDVLTASDMVDAGITLGPRVYSTGPGVGFWAYNLKSLEHTKKVLKQYSEYFDTKSIKMYRVGNRKARQWIIMASKEQRLMPTTEGSLNIRLNITQLLDGYPGHEHNIPISPVYSDLVKVIADAKMAVTPTMLVAYGGPSAEDYFYSTELPYNDAKLARFTPYDVLASSSRRRDFWSMKEEQVFQQHAVFMKDLVEAGGLAGVGSHGQLQGLGYHWELWAVQAGGMKEHDALRVSTIIGAEALGLDGDLGSIEPGKLADLVILDRNPLDNIRNTNTVFQVMKNGRLYDGGNLNEIYPLQRTADTNFWKQNTPKGKTLPGVKN